MPTAPVYQVLAEDLRALGVDSVFGLLSDDICLLVATLDAIGVRFIGGRHEFETVVREDLPMVVVVMNDAA